MKRSQFGSVLGVLAMLSACGGGGGGGSNNPISVAPTPAPTPVANTCSL